MKTIAKKIIAAITSLALLIPSATIMAARGEGDVNVATGKSAISKCYGAGGWGEDVVANVTGDGIFTCCTSAGQLELVTVDMGRKYPINEVIIGTYGNNTSTDAFGFGTDAVFEVYVSNTDPGQSTDLSTTDGVKLNVIGDTQFVANTGGGYTSYYELASAGSYRYVQVKYVKGTDAVADMRLTEIEVYTSQEAANGGNYVNVSTGKSAISKCYGAGGWGEDVVANVTGDGIFCCPTAAGQLELVTVDLGTRYPINEVSVGTYGNNTITDDFGFGTDVFEVYVSNTDPGQSTDLSENGGVKLNVIGDTQFVANPGGGYTSYYELANEGSYRFVQVKYIEGTDAVADMRLTEIEVYTTEEAASNVPTVISVGKPVYSEFFDGWNYNFIALNDGDNSTEHWMYIASGQFGNGISGVNSDGTIIDDYFDHVINLEAKFPIEKVTVSKGNNSVDGVSVANDPNAAASDWIPLVYDEISDEYYLDTMDAEMFGADYQFVKVEITPLNHSDSERLAIVNEVSVYTTSAAAASVTPDADMVNIAVGKSFTSNDPNGYGDQFASYVNDGNMSTQWFTFATTPQITYDLGHAYTIENVRTYKQGNWASDGRVSGYAIAKVEVSNDPNFNSDSTVVLMGQKYRINNDGNGWSNYTSFSQNELPADFGKYRYVRITGNPNADVAWQLNEVEIYTNKAEAALQNVAVGSTAEFINGGAAGLGSTMENLIDGDSSTWCYSAGGMAVIKLPYPMTIDQIEIDSRPGYDNLTNNFTNLGGYNVWLSLYPFEGDANHPEEPGLVTKVSSAERVDQTGNRLYHAGATVVTEVEDENRYTYVTVQCPSNGEFFIYDVRILSNDPITEDEVNVEFVGEQVKDSTITLTANYRSLEPVDMTVNLYIARYDDNQLTDVIISDDIDFTGVGGAATLEYTITEEVTAQTQFKAFIWEKDTLRPFA